MLTSTIPVLALLFIAGIETSQEFKSTQAQESGTVVIAGCRYKPLSPPPFLAESEQCSWYVDQAAACEGRPPMTIGGVFVDPAETYRRNAQLGCQALPTSKRALKLTDDTRECPYQTCTEILSRQGVNCRSVTEAILCGRTIVLNNPACPASVQDAARYQLGQGDEYLKQNCQPNITALPTSKRAVELTDDTQECPYQTCTEILSRQGVNCRSVSAATLCGRTIVLNNPACPASVQNTARYHLGQGDEYLKQNCQPNITDTATCNVTKCLKGIYAQGFTCDTLFEAMLCAYETTYDNPACDPTVINFVEEEEQNYFELLVEQCLTRMLGDASPIYN